MQPMSHQIMRLLTKSKTWDLELWSDHCPNLIFPNTRVPPIDATQLRTWWGTKEGGRVKKLCRSSKKLTRPRCWDVGDIGKECRGGNCQKVQRKRQRIEVQEMSGVKHQHEDKYQNGVWLFLEKYIAFRVFSFLSEFHMLASKRITFCACWRKEEMHSFLLLGLSHFYRSV